MKQEIKYSIAVKLGDKVWIANKLTKSQVEAISARCNLVDLQVCERKILKGARISADMMDMFNAKIMIIK